MVYLSAMMVIVDIRNPDGFKGPDGPGECHMSILFGRDGKHARILNQEAPWLWAVKSSWHFEGFAGDEILFERATLDLLLQNKVDPKCHVWLRVTEHLPVCGVLEHVLQVPEESIGRNFADAITISLGLMKPKKGGSKPQVTIRNLAWMYSISRVGHWGPVEYEPSVYVGEVVTIVKPPKGGSFEKLLQEAMKKRMVPKFALSYPQTTDANELYRWLREHFAPFCENAAKITVNRQVIAEAVRTMFWHDASHVIAKYNAGQLVAVVKAEDWEALPEALQSFDTTWS